jgi:hypothetical protein
MAGDNYYLMSALPGLGDLGSLPPMSLARLLEQVIDCEGNHVVLEALLLSDDLLQRQALLSNEIDQAEPAVLSAAQARDEEPLPDYLEPASEDISGQNTIDALWNTYYHYAAGVAENQKNSFLQKWIEYEVGLRNALVVARAKALNLDSQDYLVAEELGSAKEDFSNLIAEWAAASDPVAGLKVLDAARWQWLWENDGWFTFKDDELAAYGAKLMLIQRWYRLSEEQN